MDGTNGSFDMLVAGLGSEERRDLLEKINTNRETEIVITQPTRDKIDSGFLLSQKLQRESLLYRLVLWARAFFTKQNTTSLYNDDLIHKLELKVNRVYPGLIEPRNHLLHALFYSKLRDLKESADFFKPYTSHVSNNPGRFYVFLSTFIVPEIASSINEEADPYIVPFTKEANSELKNSLIKKLEDVLSSVATTQRQKLYFAVKTVEWIRQFSELPYIHFLSQFTAIVSESYTCPYANAQMDYTPFSRVLCDAASIPNETLEALFLYPQKEGVATIGIDEDNERAIKEFLTEAESSISKIQSFISSIPLNALGKIIFGDYDWQCENYGGGEDWFYKFKEEWKKVFEQRWTSWLKDKKKYQLVMELRERFAIEEFPSLPNRPWTDLWGGLPFRCEMTGGFLYWFFKNEYDEVMVVLNGLVLEGVFVNKDNRNELSEAVNVFVDVMQGIKSFVEATEENGSISEMFLKIKNEHMRSVKNQGLIDSLITNAENTMRSGAKRFCSSTRTLECIFHGILDEGKDRNYEGLQNLMTIKGRGNRVFRENMAKVREILNEARGVFAEIEPLDMPFTDDK